MGLFRKRADRELAIMIIENIFPLITHVYNLRSRQRTNPQNRGFRHSVMNDGKRFVTYEYLCSDTPWIIPNLLNVRIGGMDEATTIDIYGTPHMTDDVLVNIQPIIKSETPICLCISPNHSWFSKKYIKNQLGKKMTVKQLYHLFHEVTKLLETYPPLF